ncbi:MAG: hypothetical protein A3H94_08070 [Acidobacteria bacterium RIFCSPLOWO2_02_FULL_60_20]|nr:MAG: hypothetical protein A3H94_08070 [Acidobacteria bacterium RIFCSPLOWO2_02_FULL_60_20]
MLLLIGLLCSSRTAPPGRMAGFSVWADSNSVTWATAADGEKPKIGALPDDWSVPQKYYPPSARPTIILLRDVYLRSQDSRWRKI